MHAEAEDGEIVRTHVTRWEDEGGLCVSVEDRIGSFEQATCALDALVMSMRLRTDFPEDVLREADACRPADLADDPTREDMRYLLSFTIDGRDAKDFDDSVSLEQLENGNVLLGVLLPAAQAFICRAACCRCCRSSYATASVRCARTRINSP